MMNTMNLDMLKEFGNGGYAQARALGELNLRTWERLFEKQMETFGLLIDNANAQIELASEAREVSDMKAMVEGQGELNRKLAEALTSKGRETLELANTSRNEYKAWMEEGMGIFTKLAGSATKAS
ncbi:MAG: hypothetical protein B0D96_06495 [Candidatus Sedimenticola endophacoides]|nr:MAG: hypothetical protein B0D94_07670 [Candidatus Sedimenticola endophacoides]OQX35555.1 MAG: hypothetical protein B0D96_06495 [Candidatus Sedimenticola endophacoides]OQX46777.1 MAG: hypothetical protein B0D86_01055 [Candidatus Sedimenticola endophacoides]OQX48279.1 MAG: hypothetical protein B0D87_06520 [Candidatus Sedimenticola endophacoides]